MVVVEIHEQRRQKDAFLASLVRARLHAIETVEKPVQIAGTGGSGRSSDIRDLRQTVQRIRANSLPRRNCDKDGLNLPL